MKKKYLDLAERVFWTFIQAGAAAVLVTGFGADGLKIAATAGGIAVVKCLLAMNIGDRRLCCGAAWRIVVTEVLTESDQVFKHLMERYMDMGFAPQYAEILADRPIDWHYVKDQLIDRGCSPDEAFLIVT